MNDHLTVAWLLQSKHRYVEILEALSHLGRYLPESLESQVDLREYAKKLEDNADVVLATYKDQAVGVLAVYINDLEKKLAYIPIVSVCPSHQRVGIGRKMVEKAIELAAQKGFRKIRLRADAANIAAISLYQALQFRTVGTTGHKVTMERLLGD